MPKSKYHVTTEDGSVYEVETDDAPSPSAKPAGNFLERALRPVDEALTEGSRMMYEGGKATWNEPTWERKAKGVSQVLRGAGTALSPALAPAALANPVATAGRLGLGMLAQQGVEGGAKAVGVPEGYSELAGDVAGGAMAAKGPPSLAAVRNAPSAALKTLTSPGVPKIIGGVGETAAGVGTAFAGHPAIGTGIAARGIGRIGSGISERRAAQAPPPRPTAAPPAQTGSNNRTPPPAPPVTAAPPPVTGFRGAPPPRQQFAPPQQTGSNAPPIPPPQKRGPDLDVKWNESETGPPKLGKVETAAETGPPTATQTTPASSGPPMQTAPAYENAYPGQSEGAAPASRAQSAASIKGAQTVKTNAQASRAYMDKVPLEKASAWKVGGPEFKKLAERSKTNALGSETSRSQFLETLKKLYENPPDAGTAEYAKGGVVSGPPIGHYPAPPRQKWQGPPMTNWTPPPERTGPPARSAR